MFSRVLDYPLFETTLQALGHTKGLNYQSECEYPCYRAPGMVPNQDLAGPRPTAAL